METTTDEKRLSKWDLIKSFLCWHNFAQSCYNYERMQALGFTHAMIPILNKLYTKKEDIAAGLKRHLVFFNTEANIGSIIPGIMAALEEKKANGADYTDETINSLKTGLMGPLAGVGDTVTQGLVKTILLAIAVDIAAQGSVAGPLFFFVCFTAYTLGIGYFLYMQGYRLGKDALAKMLEGTMVDRVTCLSSALPVCICKFLFERSGLHVRQYIFRTKGHLGVCSSAAPAGDTIL